MGKKRRAEVDLPMPPSGDESDKSIPADFQFPSLRARLTSVRLRKTAIMTMNLVGKMDKTQPLLAARRRSRQQNGNAVLLVVNLLEEKIATTRTPEQTPPEDL